MNFDEEAMKIRRGKHGVIETIPREVLKTHDDLSILYTPGVAQPCREITKDPDLSFDLTCRGNMIAVVSDGTRVLGLGDIGPEAAMPVMEGNPFSSRSLAASMPSPSAWIRRIRKNSSKR